MTDAAEWLPALLLLEDYQGDWGRYLEAVYRRFVQDFLVSRPTLQGRPVSVRRQRTYQGREATSLLKKGLALQVAAELLDGFPDGVFFVDLAPLQDPTLSSAAVDVSGSAPEK